jgi:hypothetical protein
MGAEGTIHLIIGDDRHVYFALNVEGHGDEMAASLRVLAPEGLVDGSPA